MKCRSRFRARGRGSAFRLPVENLKLHCDASIGASITIATGVSNWADLSGNGNDLLQAVGARQPSYANNTITFDGVSEFLKAAAFTLNQPTTIYLVYKQISWTNQRWIFDGNTLNKGALIQDTATPTLKANAGIGSGGNSNLAVGATGVVAVVFNGASSSIRVNNTTATSGNFGANNMGGFTLGARPDSFSPSNIAANEIAAYSDAHGATTQASIIAGLMGKWPV